MLVPNAQYPFLSEFLRDVLFALSFVLLVAAWLFLKRIPGWLRSIRGAGWLTAEGKVETATVSTFAEQSLGEVAYSYLVEGERYSGYFSRQFADERDAWNYIGPLKGQSIFVRYKPGNPSVSAVRIAEQNPLFSARQQSFARRLPSHLNTLLFGGEDWQELTVFAARSWPISKGKIEFGTVTQQRTHYVVTLYTSEIAYSYAVGSEYYSGHFARIFFRESSAHKFVDELKGEDVFVRYKPGSPNVSALRRQDQQAVQFA